MEKNKDEEIKYCRECKQRTMHLKCGFGESGSICGNGRWRCKKCGKERI